MSNIPQFMTETGLVPLVPNLGVDGVFYIQGELCQIVHIIVQGDAQVQCEPGAMVYTSNEVQAKTKFGGFGRALGGGGFFKDVYHNKSRQPGYVGLTPNFPACIIPLNLGTPTFGNRIMCKHDAFLGSVDPNCRVGVTTIPSESLLGCCFSGVNFFVQDISSGGWVFLAAHGTIMTKELGPNEELLVDTHSIVAFTSLIRIDVKPVGGCSTMCCGGEGIFNTVVKGPGLVILQSMPMEKLRKLFGRPPPPKKKKKGINITVN